MNARHRYASLMSTNRPAPLSRLENALLLFVAVVCYTANGGDAKPASASPGSFASFQAQYPLPPVHDYTFLGTERSEDKPIVTYGGRIELWFDPAEHVPWLRQAVQSGSFEVGL